MARKRNTGSEPIVSGGASPAPEKRTAARPKPTRNHTHTVPSALVGPAPAVVAAPLSASLDLDEVARLAYSYWEARGWQGGSAEEDWLRAEQELRGRLACAASV